jgi:biopolymer transport protein ExbB
VLWLLTAINLISMTFILERWLFYRRRKVHGETLAAALNDLLRQGDIRGAYDLVNKRRAVECAIVAAGLRALQRGSHACSEAMLSAKAARRRQLESGLSVLATIGNNAPFVGLLGTVLGIIKAAHDLTGSATGNPNAVMSGVFEALVATAVGLFVAIPAVVFFNIFRRRVQVILTQSDSLAHLVLAYSHAESSKPPTALAAK